MRVSGFRPTLYEEPEDGWRFFWITENGKVHVFDRERQSEHFPEGSLAAALHSDTVARCGRWLETRKAFYNFVSIFPDDRLCHACGQSVPEEHRPTLFEHPTSWDES